MTSKRIRTFYLLFMALCWSCKKEEFAVLKQVNRTVIVYMVADNNLSSYVLQMQKGWNNDFDGNLIVDVDRGGEYNTGKSYYFEKISNVRIVNVDFGATEAGESFQIKKLEKNIYLI